MVNQQTSCETIEQPPQLGTLPPKCRSVEYHVSPTTIVDLMLKNESETFRTRTLLDSGSGSSWCHADLLKNIKYNDLGSIIMQVQVFEGVKKRKYRYVELFYIAEGKVGTLRCFVTDEYSWFNNIKGLTVYASEQIPGEYVIDPGESCDHDGSKKEIALILGPYASNKLRNRDVPYKYAGDLLFESYRTGKGSGYVFSGLLPKHLNRNVIHSYKITPMIESHLGIQGLNKGPIEFEPHFDQQKFDLLENLEFLWNKEMLGVKPQEYRKTDEIAIKKFYESVEWHEDLKKYSVGMPFNYRIERLKPNKELAYARLHQLIKKFVQDKTFAVQYALVIKEYIEKYAELVLDPEAPTEGPVCYLPHRAVVRTDSNTTKLRIVFDGSAKCGRDEVCLNDCLMQGPNLVQNIAACLINFRTRNYAFSADLEKAFLQILIKLAHRDVLRFLFPEDPLNPLSKIKVYRFKVVIFGANCSPFHLAAVIIKHMSIYIADKHTRDTLMRGLYVDNLFQTRNSPQQLVSLFHDCRKLFAEAGMNLRSWRSDVPELNELAKEHEVLEDTTEIKVLGMLWDSELSTIRLLSKPKWSGNYCRRDVLSYANQYYDPLGLIVPVEVKMRIFLQGLWGQGFSWDQSFHEFPELVQQWDMLRSDCETILSKSFPRSVCNTDVADIHVFCDASKDIYGAAVYITSREKTGIRAELVQAKAKIVGKDAPKFNTIPKLELMAMLVGAKIDKYCTEALFHIKINTFYLWSDSKTALSWCSSYDKKEEFVSNRVRQIREILPQAKLMYVPSELNPADILTRQPKADCLINNQRWWNGPEFLVKPSSEWPVQDPKYNLMPDETMQKEFVGTQSDIHVDGDIVDCKLRPDLIKASKADKSELMVASIQVAAQDDDLDSEYSFEGFESPEIQKVVNRLPAVGLSQGTFIIDWSKWNSFHDILRAYARTFSAIDAFKKKIQHKCKEAFNYSTIMPLIPMHFRKSKLLLVKQMQLECFPCELQLLCKGKAVKKGKCRNFGLHLDKDGIIRCKGRFGNSPSLENINLPILCGTDHHLTKLLLWNIHNKENCPGFSYAIHRIKKDLYFPKFKVSVRKTLNNCAKCKIHKSRAYAYPGNPPLPSYRTEAKTPFEFSGLDYAGPFHIKSHDFGGKVWICLFTCLVTRACHLVIVPDNSTKSFIEALQDLSTFYRMPRLLLSDNATQFHAADRLLRQFKANKLVQDTLGAEEMQWHFIPARASHIGGVYERMIGLLKVELRKMSFGTKLTFQEAKVLISEVQRIINNRPLTRATASLDDDTCITPMDLIRGYQDKASIFPEVYLDEFLEDLWENQQNLPQQFIRKNINREKFFKNLNDGYFEALRFSHPGCPQKHGQGQKHYPPRVGDVVLIKQDTLRSDWPRGIIVELPTSSDGQIRRAKVMNSNKHVLERAICDLYSLEINAEQVIPPYLDSRIKAPEDFNENSTEKSTKSQRKVAIAAKNKISELYGSDKV